jgi:hypothetical protein
VAQEKERFAMATHLIQGVSAAEVRGRHDFVERMIRLNRSEGLEPAARHLVLDERYISGKIDFDEYNHIVDS